MTANSAWVLLDKWSIILDVAATRLIEWVAHQHRDRQTHRQTHRHTDRHTEAHAHTSTSRQRNVKQTPGVPAAITRQIVWIRLRKTDRSITVAHTPTPVMDTVDTLV